MGAVLGAQWRGEVEITPGVVQDALLVWTDVGLIHAWTLTVTRGSAEATHHSARRLVTVPSTSRPRRMSHEAVDHISARFEMEEKEREEASALVGAVVSQTWQGHQLVFKPGAAWDANGPDNGRGQDTEELESSEDDSDDDASHSGGR